MIITFVAVISFLVAGLTFFTGFGLGTLLLPLFALFFPVQIAVAVTAVVHLANNLFKIILVGENARLNIVLLFGLPAAFAALAGSWVLVSLSGLQPLFTYFAAGKTFEVVPVKFAVGLLLIVFSLFELTKSLERYSHPVSWIPAGGILSGFFGGLSGHQGALRTIFLSRAGLDKEAFIGTVSVVAVMVDIARVTVYGLTVFQVHFTSVGPSGSRLAAAAAVSAWLGSFLSSRFLKKITMRGLRILIGILLMAVGSLLVLGWI